MPTLLSILVLLLEALQFVCVADAILSWFQGPDQFPRKLTDFVTEPMYAPIRRLMEPITQSIRIDFTPLLMIMLLGAIQRALASGLVG